ncbi:MAG: magnesium transporter [Verrucomicrobiales bacterium]
MSGSDPTTQNEADVETILEGLRSRSPDRIAEIAKEAHPGDVEQAFERLDDAERGGVLDRIPSGVLSEWADNLTSGDVEHRLNTLPKRQQEEVLDSLSDDELADFLQDLDEEDLPRFIALLPEEKRRVSSRLMRFPEHTAGGRMTMAMATLGEDLTVKQALDELRSLRDEAEILSRIYIVDRERRILGKVRLRDLAFSTWDTPVRDVMDTDQRCVDAMADQEEAAQMIARYDLMALPVVDENQRLLGVVTHDDAIEILEEESTEDLERISGIGGERGDQSYLQTPVLAHLKRRFGWVLVLAFLALTSGWVLHAFEDVLKSFYILALYLPMVVAAGGNTGGQSATTIIRAMALGEVGSREFGRVVLKEGRIGILLGGLLGLFVALQVQFLLPAGLVPESLGLFRVALVVGFALTAQVFTSTLVGALLPLAARKARLDPAVVAAPAITTLVDVSGSLIYFSLAQAFFH